MKGHPGAVFKGFSTRSEASDFVGGGGRGTSGGGRGGRPYYGRGLSSYQSTYSILYQSSGYQPSYSSNARQRYHGNFTSNRRFAIYKRYTHATVSTIHC